MALYLFTQRSATGRRLLETKCFTQWTPDTILTKGDMIFTWGRYCIGYIFELNGARLLNEHLCCDKRVQDRLFTKAKLPIPKRYFTQQEWERDGKPDLIRKPYNGQGGKGIIKCTDHPRNRPEWFPEYVYQEFINKIREFRVMQVGSFTAFYMEKLKPKNSVDICWNLDQGVTWKSMQDDTEQLRAQLNKLAEQTLKVISYDFGAIDIMMDKEKKLWLLECNSRPGLGERNIMHFAYTLRRFYNVNKKCR